MGVQLLIAYVFNILDLIFTTVWVKKYGIDIEANPIGRFLYKTKAVYAVKTIGLGAIFFGLYKLLSLYPKWSWTATVILVVYALLTVYHILIAIKLWSIEKKK